MTSYKRFVPRLITGILVLFSFIITTAYAQDGKALFSQNCASCHAIDKKLVGPALLGVEDRWKGNRKNLHAWIKNTDVYLKTGDAYAIGVYNDNGKQAMNKFQGVLDDKQIDAVLDYIKAWKPPVTTKEGDHGGNQSEGDNTLLFGVLTLILAVIALILLQVNANLRKLSYDKTGVVSDEPIPFYKNRSYIAMFAVLVFLVGGYMTTKGAIGLGRNKGYQPKQPIFYSHKVHAGINQINCLYCHGGAQDSKHASIPSVNVCMNCHQAITEYKGEKLYTEEGDEVNGTEQIKKLYEYAGFTPGKPFDATKAKPIEWTKIHNLPDHVYFNHSQHIKAGKVQCQTCHGEITKMDEVKQFADLSMGWCINCHRETKVQFKENGFYSIYQKYHDGLKDGTIDSTKGITVEKIGGTECQKCHY